MTLNWGTHNLIYNGNVVSVAAWRDYKWLSHGFTLAKAGNMSYQFGGKDLVDDARSAIAPSWITMQQVHGNFIVDVDANAGSTKADGMITRKPGSSLAVLVADCVPLLFTDPVAQTVAVAHAGRRGTFAGIAQITFKQLLKRGSRAQDIQVAIGPSIGPCCYVYNNQPLDLWSLNEQQLLRAGAGRVIRTDVCTKHTQDFYSHQRDPKGGRFAGFMGVL